LRLCFVYAECDGGGLAKANFSGDSRKKIFGFTSPDVSKSTFFPATAGRKFLVLHPLMLAKAPFFRRQPEENFWFYIP